MCNQDSYRSSLMTCLRNKIFSLSRGLHLKPHLKSMVFPKIGFQGRDEILKEDLFEVLNKDLI